MSGQEYITDDKAYVPPVTAESSVAQVDAAEQHIRYNQVIVEEAESEALRLEEDALKAEAPVPESGASSSPSATVGASDEGKLYMDIGLEMLGLKAVGAAIDFVEDRAGGGNKNAVADHDDDNAPLVSKTIDQDIASTAARKPGIYNKPSLGHNDAPEDGGLNGSLLSRANIVSDSIRMESPERLDGSGKFTQTANWQGTDASLAAVQQVRSTMRQQSLENKHVYANVQQVRMEHNSMLGQVNRMAPGLDLGSGPTIRPAELLREVKESTDPAGGGFI